MLARRLLWHVVRTPAAHLIKGALRTRHRAELGRRRALSAGLPKSDAAIAVAGQLEVDGYARADDLIDRASLQGLARAIETKQPAEAGGPSVFGEHKNFWSHVLESEMVDGSMPAASPFVRFALQPSLLSALALHYGELPRLDYVAVTHSRHSPGPLKFSQLWHRDHDDTKVVKLFVYLTDVDDADGPFTFLPAPQSDRVGFHRRSHRADEEIAGKVDLSGAVRMKGPRLTTFLVETSRCLHMGSRVDPGHDRLMYTASFISAPRIFPERLRPFFRLEGNENPVERMVLVAGSDASR